MTFKVDSIRVETTIYEGANRVYSAANKPTAADVGLSNHTNSSSGVYGSVDVKGAKGTYSGINFPDVGFWTGVDVKGNFGVGDNSNGGSFMWHFAKDTLMQGKVPWARIPDAPATATRWPTPAEVGAQPAGSYAAASHTHPWAQVTGQPVTATRWPTFAEVTAAPATATRWPTFAEVSGKPATYPATAHTHPVSQVTGLGTAATTAATDYAKSQGRVVNNGNLFLDSGMYGINGSPPNTVSGYGAMIVARNSDTGLQISGGHNTDNLHFRGFSGSGSQFTPWRQVYHTGNMPATATRWPTFAEVTGKPTDYATTWGSVAAKPATATRWPTLAEIGAQPAGSYAAASHTHPWSQVTGAPVYTTRWPNWAEVGGKPATMPPAAHDHLYLRGTYVGGGLEVPSYFGGNLLKLQMLSGTRGGVPDVAWSDAIWASSYSGTDVVGSNVLVMSKSGAARIGFRQQAFNSAAWGTFNEIYHSGRKPTPAEIGAQAAGSYAAASHTHPWAQITGVPVQATRWPTAAEAGAAPASHSHPWAQITGAPAQATRWPTKAEVGLSNVGNYTSSTQVAINTHALRDGNGDLVARQFHGDGSNLLNLKWAQLVGAPVTALRWPNWNEVSGKPAVVSDWINLFNGGITGRTSRLPIPPQMLNHLKAGKIVELRIWVNRSGAIAGDRRCVQHFIDGTDGWVNYVNDKIGLDFTWYGVSYIYVANASTGHGSNANCIFSQYQNITKIDMKLL